MFTDAALTQGGCHIPIEGEGDASEECGNSLPDFLFGIAIRGMQTGVTELGSLLFYWAGLCHHVASRRMLQTHHIAVALDNLEDVLGLRSGKFRGEQSLEKASLARHFHRLNDEHGIEVFVHHAPTRAQLADDASRDKDNRELRTNDPEHTEMQTATGQFDVDWMSSHGCRHLGLDGKPVPHVSWGHDPESVAKSVMEQDISLCPGTGTRAHGCLFPPPKMLRVMVRHLLECRANVVLVAPDPREPYPTWRASVERYVLSKAELGDGFCSDRAHEWWVTALVPGYAACHIFFE